MSTHLELAEAGVQYRGGCSTAGGAVPELVAIRPGQEYSSSLRCLPDPLRSPTTTRLGDDRHIRPLHGRCSSGLRASPGAWPGIRWVRCPGCTTRHPTVVQAAPHLDSAVGDLSVVEFGQGGARAGACIGYPGSLPRRRRTWSNQALLGASRIAGRERSAFAGWVGDARLAAFACTLMTAIW